MAGPGLIWLCKSWRVPHMGQEMLSFRNTWFHPLWGVHDFTHSLYIHYILLNLSVWLLCVTSTGIRGWRREHTMTFDNTLFTGRRQPSQAGDLFTVGQRINTMQMQDNQYGSHSFIHYSTVSLTSFRTGAVLDRQSPGRFSTSPGITGLWIFCPAGRCTLIVRSRNADIALTTDTPESPD